MVTKNHSHTTLFKLKQSNKWETLVTHTREMLLYFDVLFISRISLHAHNTLNATLKESQLFCRFHNNFHLFRLVRRRFHRHTHAPCVYVFYFQIHISQSSNWLNPTVSIPLFLVDSFIYLRYLYGFWIFVDHLLLSYYLSSNSSSSIVFSLWLQCFLNQKHTHK